MRRFLAALLLLPALVLADAYTFPPLRLGKGYAGPVTIDVTWADGTARDLTSCTGTLTVYSKAPIGGVGGTVLWTKTITPAGSPTNRASFTVTAPNTAKPGTFYVELTLSEAGVVDALHGQVIIEGL